MNKKVKIIGWVALGVMLMPVMPLLEVQQEASLNLLTKKITKDFNNKVLGLK